MEINDELDSTCVDFLGSLADLFADESSEDEKITMLKARMNEEDKENIAKFITWAKENNF